MKSAKRILVVLCMLTAGAAQAQDLLSVYDLALQNDPALKEATQQLASAREAQPQAKARLLPNLFVGGDLSYTDRDTRDSFNPANEGREDFTNRALALRLEQPIYRRDYWMQLEQVENQIAQAEAVYENAKLDLMARVINAYFNILAAQDNLTVSKAQTEANLRQLDQAKQRFEVGLIAITDVHEAQAAYDRSRANQIAAANEVDAAWQALFEIVGPHPRELAKLGEKLPLDTPEPADIESWASAALEQNYEIIAAMNSAEVARKQIEVARSGHYPALEMEASYGMSRTNADTGSDIDDAQVGLQLTIPLYRGGSTSSQVRQAQYDYEAAKEALDQVRRSVNSSVRNAYRAVNSTISRVEALQATTVSSKSALESTQAGYEVGTRTLVDVLNAQTQMFDATRNYLRSRYDYLINGLLLKQRASILTREDLASVNQWLGE